jgi:hypothetical protein
MNARISVRPAVAKEVRALLPTWLAGAIAVGAAVLARDTRLSLLPVLVYGLAILALGAQSVGQEYTHRTLATFLALPRERGRLLLTKVLVLAAMSATLNGLGWLLVVHQPEFAGVFDRRIFIVVVMCGFFLAPWLTMVCRNPLAGIVFSIVVPATLLIAGDLIGLAIYGLDGAVQIDEFKVAFLWRGLFVACAVAAIWAWRIFARLEAIEGRGTEIEVPDWLLGRAAPAVAPSRRRHPFWVLVRKELRLQQLTFVVMTLFIAGWAGLTLLARVTDRLPVIPVDALAFLYFAILTILIGSLASAEERQLGTVEWQALLPIAAWKQWAIKLGVVFGLVALLGLALPALIMRNEVLKDPFRWLPFAGFVFLTTTLSVFVSSLSTSGVRAMVSTLPVVAVLPPLAQFVLYATNRMTGRRLGVAYSDLALWTAAVVLGAGFIALALRFGLTNHRSTERSVGRTLFQSGTLAGYLVLAVAALTLM